MNMYKPVGRRHYLLILFFFNLIAAALVVIYTLERNDTYRDNQLSLAKKSVIYLSSSINLYIDDLRKRIHLFTDLEQDLINRIANHPLDEVAHTLFENKISLHYPEHFAWTIASNAGTSLLESSDYLVGKGCRKDLRKFADNPSSNRVYIHSSPLQKRYHFDIMVPIEKTKRVFFISFNLSKLAKMLKQTQLPGHQMLLLMRDDQNLIEVTADGGFYTLRREPNHTIWQSIIGGNQISNKNKLRLSEDSMQHLEFKIPVPGTKWLLADLPKPSLYSSENKRLWQEAIVIFFTVILVSCLIIFLIKRRQDKLFLLRNEQELEEFINSSPVIMWMAKGPGHDIIYNDAWRKFNGSVEKKLKVRHYHQQLVHVEDQEEYLNIFIDSLQKHEAFEHEYRLLDKTQKYRWLKETAVPRFNDQNHYLGHTGVCADITERKQIEESNRILFNLLKYSFESLDDFLLKSMQAVTSITWLSLSDKGGIFLIDENQENPSLKLVCSHNLNPELQTLCARVPFGQCLCGLAAATKEIQFAKCVDDRHHNSFQSMQPHGHYNVPLKHGDHLLGVMVLYLPHGHHRQDYEVQFLQRVSHILGLGISKHNAESQVIKQAHYDPLTKLPNRYLLMHRFQQVYEETKNQHILSALIFIDLDHFKKINDSYGHLVGDKVLKQMAQRLNHVLKKDDMLSRQGGDEFVILLSSINTDRSKAINEINSLSEKLLASITKPLIIEEHSFMMSMSMGIALIPDDGRNVHEFLSHADAAMYQAKKRGRNTFAFYSPELQKKLDEKQQLEADLRLAIDQDQLIIYYQQQVNGSNEIIGTEALLRWNHPQLGLISPDIFIPIAEESGQILKIGTWVLNSSCKQFKTFNGFDSGGLLKHVAVNVSASQFHHSDFIQHIKQALLQSEIHPQQLTLELTESIMINNLNETVDKMLQIKKLGVGLSIDDFGTGYSSLSYLKNLPLDQLKIDKSFVDEVETDLHDRVIIETIISMAHHLSFDVIAEGVENIKQLSFLQQAGCSNFQGYLYSKPLPAEEFIALLIKA